MEIIDAQVHTWDLDRPDFPWQLNTGDTATDARRREHFGAHTVTAGQLIAAMDAAGVDAALAVSLPIYGFSNAYALHAAAKGAGRIGVVGLIDPGLPDVEERVRNWRATPGMLALRTTLYIDREVESVRHGPMRRVLAAAERHDVPMCVYPPGRLADMEALARDFPDLQFIVDHIGLAQPPVICDLSPEPFKGFEGLLRLAACPNVTVKATGLPSLSHQKFPFRDTWPALLQVIDAFGPERVMWGTDFTRVPAPYREGVEYIRQVGTFSEAERAQIMGGTLRRVFRWQPAVRGQPARRP